MAKKKKAAKNSEQWSLDRLDTKQLALVAVAGFLLCYLSASWAIDSGSLWAYFFAFVFFYYGVVGTTRTVKGLRKS